MNYKNLGTRLWQAVKYLLVTLAAVLIIAVVFKLRPFLLILDALAIVVVILSVLGILVDLIANSISPNGENQNNPTKNTNDPQ